MADDLRDAALLYHRLPVPGKLAVVATKPLANQRDLALAYSPGVAAACEAIVEDPNEAATVTSRANLVAVITNGTAVLGLGAIGPLAAKPVMEGKAVLFKKFAGIDVFDLEIDETDPDRLVDIIAALEPSFGGINLEDIKAPECFEVEEKLRSRMGIPVFHDDQHGTAIIVGAAVRNGLEVVGKNIAEVRLVASGAGAAGLACLDMLLDLGLRRENVVVTDRQGVITKAGVTNRDGRKAFYASDTKARTLAEALHGADIFLGLSGPGVLTKDMLIGMAARPLILALANPIPEIMPEDARAARPDAVIATGRSDYPNQVNNVLCFPYIFRGALDVGATEINQAMKIACVEALAGLAKIEPSDVAAAAYGDEQVRFGPEYLIPKPFDPRLILELAPAVAAAAMKSGVATRAIADFDAYRQKLSEFVFRSGLLMRPVFDRARQDPRRLIYAEGEDSRVLRAVQLVVDEGLAKPILVGRREVVDYRIGHLGLRIERGRHFELVDPQDDPRYRDYWSFYHRLMERKGVSPADAREVVRTRTTAIAALFVRKGEADAMLCGTIGRYAEHLGHVLDIIGLAEGARAASAVGLIILPRGTFFLCDTQVTPDPSADEIVEMTLMAAESVRRFGLTPRVALLSHSSFGSDSDAASVKMRTALAMIHRQAPDLEAEGEMPADAALSEEIRQRQFPNSRLKGQANLLVMSNLDAAHITFSALMVLGDGLPVGPLLNGLAQPAHILTPSVTARGIVNMSAVAVVDALQHGRSATAPAVAAK